MLATFPVCVIAGTFIGYWPCVSMGRGKDAIVPPVIWTTPLGFVFGTVAAAVLNAVTVLMIASEKNEKRRFA